MGYDAKQSLEVFEGAEEIYRLGNIDTSNPEVRKGFWSCILRERIGKSPEEPDDYSLNLVRVYISKGIKGLREYVAK